MMAQPTKTSGLAIASLVLSIIGISLLAVIFGHIALSQIKNSNGMVSGRGLAIAGLVIRYIEIAGTIILIAAIILLATASGGATTGLAPLFR